MKKSLKQVYLWGGLGNVLYQINLAYYLCENGYDVYVNKGLLDYNNKFINKAIKIHKGVFERVDLFIDLNKIGIINNLRFKDIFYIISYKMGLNLKSFKFFNHDWPTDNDLLGINLFLGYFQKTKIISSYLSSSFRSKFISSIDKKIIDLVNEDSTILLHARFGDKIDVSEFDVNYSSLFDILRGFDSIVIVTDDVKNAGLLNFNSNVNIIVVCSEDIIDDFYLISSAKTVVIGRSSFSWWATEISPLNQKIFQPAPFYKHVGWELFSNKIRIGYES